MLKLLIIDDSTLMCRQLTVLFEAEGNFEVSQARNSKEAQEIIRIFQPELVILNLHMPEMGNIVALSLLMIERPVPIVVLLSVSDKNSLATIKMLNLGMVDCIAKPGGTISLSIGDIWDELLAKVHARMRSCSRWNAVSKQYPAKGYVSPRIF